MSNQVKAYAAASNARPDLEYDAVLLLRPGYIRTPTVGYKLSGEIYFDKADRFDDGTDVTTSTVRDVIGEATTIAGSTCVVKTRNTTYLVVRA